MGYIVYATINDFFGEYLKESGQKLENYEIVVISKDIVGDLTRKNSTTSQTEYISKYKNVDFLMNLYPDPAVMEFYTGSTRDSFISAYRGQLTRGGNLYDLCCLVDLVVNDDKKIFLLCVNSEYLTGFFEIMDGVLQDQFKMKMYSYAEFKADRECVNDIGNIDEIKVTLAYQLDVNDLIDDVTGEFFNSLYSDMESTYRKVLMDKSVDDLVKLALKKGIYVNKRKPKETIVDHIMAKLLSSDKDD